MVPGRARALGHARHALGARCLHLPQRLPARLAGPAVLHPVPLLPGCCRAGLPALQHARSYDAEEGGHTLDADAKVKDEACKV
jgi:hypothetical protein